MIGTGDDPSRVGANGELVRKAVTIIAALALIVGGLGVTNTMAMAVLERERELALLSAVGWRRARIASSCSARGWRRACWAPPSGCCWACSARMR